MKAFHNDSKIKEKYLNRIRQHREADELVKGLGWGSGKGCAIGCTFENYNHALMEEEWDVPVMLAHLEDVIFEGLPREESQAWPERFTSAIKVGSDLSMVAPKFLLALIQRVYSKTKDKAVLLAIKQVIQVLKNWVENGKLDKKAAERAAEEAAGAVGAAGAEYKWMADKLIELIEAA